MPFETPNIDLVGNITASVHEHGGVAPTTIIRTDTSWAVNINWSLLGTNWQMIGGTWHVHVNLESMGPGPELSLVDFADPACMNAPLPSVDGQYFCHFDVPAGVATAAHQGTAYKLVVLLTYRNLLGQPGPIAAYYEGPILQFYNAS